MSQSQMVEYTKWSPNHSGPRTMPITKIAIHHMEGRLTAEECGDIFYPTSRQASSQYGIGYDGKVAQYVLEEHRAWTTSSEWCDQRAVTIEVSNSSNGMPWPVSEHVLDVLIDLVTDICLRNGIEDCSYTGKKDGVIQRHDWYKDKVCPGPYLAEKLPFIAAEVNDRLKAAAD